MSDTSNNVITIGQHVVVEKKNFKKVYKVSVTGTLKLGKEHIDMSAIVGQPFWTTFKIISPVNHLKELSTLEISMDDAELLDDLKEDLPSGVDNRTIVDDGTSQKLSKEEIISLRESGKSGREIVNKLIENSTSFIAKTEYSQEKYILKKGRKYCSHLTIYKPTIVDLHEIDLRNNKVNSLRMDVLSQILSYSNVQADGLYLLYDSSTTGLVAASLLDRIGTNTSGNLLFLHSGKKAQISTIKHMNFPTEQHERLTTVNIYSFLKLYFHSDNNEVIKKPDDIKNLEDFIQTSGDLDTKITAESHDTENCENMSNLKRKTSSTDNSNPSKRFKWASYYDERAVELIKSTQANGLIIVAKEHPLSIAKALLHFVGRSRPFIIYHVHREPLLETYIELKQRFGVANLKLFSNFLRSYQVLPDRTHPDIDTNDCSGYLLTGYLVN